MKNSGELAGLTKGEKAHLANAATGVVLTGEIAKIAVDAIAAYRRDESGDAALALDVGFEIVEVLKRNKKLSLDEKVEAVRDAIDQMLRRRNYS